MKTRILLVDYERSFTSMMKMKLEADGCFEVREENDPARALDAAKAFDPDLVLLDVIMPETNGFEVVRRLREHRQFNQTPIIFLSALVRVDAPAPRFPISLSGPCTFLSKEASLQRLIEAIEKAADLSVV